MSKTKIKLPFAYSGDGETWRAGDVVAVDAAEADRLIGLGATLAPNEIHPLDHDGDGKPGGSLPGPRRARKARDA